MSKFVGKGEDLDSIAGLRYSNIEASGLVEPLEILYRNKAVFAELSKIKSTAESIDKAISSVDPTEVSKINYLTTTDRLYIELNNTAKLLSPSVGDIIWNMAAIFKNENSNVIEKEVTVSTDGFYLYFDELDDVTSMYCVVSYLTYRAL